MTTDKNLGRRAYSPEEVGKLYGVVTETVYEWLKSGKLVGMRISDGPRAKWRITPAALDDFDRSQIRNRCSPRDDGETVAGT